MTRPRRLASHRCHRGGAASAYCGYVVGTWTVDKLGQLACDLIFRYIDLRGVWLHSSSRLTCAMATSVCALARAQQYDA
eukprot:COSAG06_NODE_35275_length_462_cov_0.707989_1_plen_78_part_10